MTGFSFDYQVLCRKVFANLTAKNVCSRWHSLFIHKRMGLMIIHCFKVVSSLMKSSLDNYLLPGTLTGSEILWIYVVQWKRDFNALAFATVYFLSLQFGFMVSEKATSNIPVTPESDIEPEIIQA